jgi:hypothetical protein
VQEDTAEQRRSDLERGYLISKDEHGAVGFKAAI